MLYIDASQAAEKIFAFGGKVGWRPNGALEISTAGHIYQAAPPGPDTAISFEHGKRLRERIEAAIEAVLRGFAVEHGPPVPRAAPRRPRRTSITIGADSQL